MKIENLIVLPKHYRLPSNLIPDLVKKGRRFYSPLFTLVIRRQLSVISASRFAFIVSQKLDKRATRRNRVKRLLREAVRQLLPQIKTGHDSIFLAKKPMIEKGLKLETVKKEVEKVFQKACLLR